MLKVLHTGDWHIGSFPGPEVNGQNARFQDICRCLDFQAMYAEEHRPDLIVVSGDIFHQARGQRPPREPDGHRPYPAAFQRCHDSRAAWHSEPRQRGAVRDVDDGFLRR